MPTVTAAPASATRVPARRRRAPAVNARPHVAATSPAAVTAALAAAGRGNGRPRRTNERRIRAGTIGCRRNACRDTLCCAAMELPPRYQPSRELPELAYLPGRSARPRGPLLAEPAAG